jgi:hypothetical protein
VADTPSASDNVSPANVGAAAASRDPGGAHGAPHPTVAALEAGADGPRVPVLDVTPD